MSTRTWKESTIDEILARFGQDTSQFSQCRSEYPGLVCQSKEVKIHHQYYQYIFERHDGKRFDDEELRLLLGKNFQTIKNSYALEHRSIGLTEHVLDRQGFRLDFANIETHMRICSRFDILRQKSGVQAYCENRDDRPAEIPPVVIIAVSLTYAILKSRVPVGLVLWQPKNRKEGRLSPWWNRVPDLLYTEMSWTSELKEWFLGAKFHVFLPFVLDFEGTAQEDEENARVTAYINGTGLPQAAISIPGAAYIGWYSDMVPKEFEELEVRRYYHAATESSPAQWSLSPERRQATIVETLQGMLERMKTMYHQAQIDHQDAVGNYDMILKVVDEATQKDDSSVEEGCGEGQPGESSAFDKI